MCYLTFTLEATQWLLAQAGFEIAAERDRFPDADPVPDELCRLRMGASSTDGAGQAPGRTRQQDSCPTRSGARSSPRGLDSGVVVGLRHPVGDVLRKGDAVVSPNDQDGALEQSPLLE